MPTPLTRPPASRARRGLAAAAVLCLLTPVVAEALAPAAARGPGRAHRQTLDAYTSRYTTPIAPGVDLTGLASTSAGHPVDSNVLTVDLSRPGVSTGVLAGRVTDTAPVSTLVRRQHAIAGVNGDYYAIGGSQAPQGPVVRNGVLQKGTAVGQFLAGVGVDGVAREARVFLNGSARWGGGADQRLDAYNSDLYGDRLPGDAIAVLDRGWGDRPLTFVRAPGKVGVVAVDRAGSVMRTWRSGGGQRVPAGGLLLVGTGRWATIAALPVGSRVSRRVGMTTDAPVPFRWGLGMGLRLVTDGVVTHHFKDDSDPQAARTALGWRNGGRTLLAVTSERTATSGGQGVNAIADEMAALGATDAVLLDGGGSTTLVARDRGAAAPSQVGAQQDGFQRPVPVGVGVFVPRGSGRVLGVQPSLDQGTVFPGLHRRVSVRAWDEWYGPATAQPVRVSYSTQAPGLAANDGPGIVRALRTGSGQLVASTAGTAPGAPGMVTGTVFLRVLQPLRSMSAPGEVRLDPGSSTVVDVTGSDGSESAAVDGTDLGAETDPRFVTVATGSDGRVRITARPGTDGALSTVTLRSGGVAVKVLVRNGFKNIRLRDPGETGAFRVSGGKTRIVALSATDRALRVEPGAGTATCVAVGGIDLPGNARQVGVTVVGDGLPHRLRAVIALADGRQRTVDLGTITRRGASRLQGALPDGALRLVAVQVTSAPGRQGGGFVLLAGLVARV